MTVTYLGRLNTPNFVLVTADLAGGKIPNGQPGLTAFFTDTAVWKVIKDDLTLADYVLPVEITFDGTVEIGKVVIKDDTAATTAAVGANGLAVDAFVNKIDQSVAESVSLSPLYGNQDVAVPGTAEPIVASATKVAMVVIFAKATNTSTVYVGTATVDKTTSKQMILQPGATVSIDVPLGFNFNLANFYVDAEVGGEGIDFMAMR